MLKQLRSQVGFTLIELLVVIGIIGILAVVTILAINPTEILKGTRDTQRLKDLGTLQGIIQQYIADNPAATGFTSESTDATGSIECGTTGWLGIDACNYANTLPVDPLNRSAEYTTTDGSLTTGALYYQVLLDSNLRYRICTRFESASNAPKLTGDGIENNFREVYSSTDAPDCS